MKSWTILHLLSLAFTIPQMGYCEDSELDLDIALNGKEKREQIKQQKMQEQSMQQYQTFANSLQCSEVVENGISTKTCSPHKSTINKKDIFKKMGAATSVAAFYGGIGAWSYFAWYSNQKMNTGFHYEDEGWFGKDTYAGGTDKLGHFFSNYTMTRWNSKVLESAGFNKLGSSLTSATLTLLFFTGIEMKDGKHAGYGFSWGDMTANVLGNVAAVVMINFPKIDEMFDFRLEYMPSKQYTENFKNGDPNLGEDYSGMHYALWYHLASLDIVKQSKNPYLNFLKFFDVGAGWHSRHYLPESDKGFAKRRELSLGVSLNVPLALNYASGKPTKKSALRTIRDQILEVFTVPGTVIRANYDLNNNEATADFPGSGHP